MCVCVCGQAVGWAAWEKNVFKKMFFSVRKSWFVPQVFVLQTPVLLCGSGRAKARTKVFENTAQNSKITIPMFESFQMYRLLSP